MEFLMIDLYQVDVRETFYKELKQYLRHEKNRRNTMNQPLTAEDAAL
jgi:hypothetical protein